VSKLKITQVHGLIRTRPEHRGTMRALGLRRISSSVVHEDSPVLQGMLRRVNHLVKVEEVTE
jgi:large subunit ribosomal protein L30